MAEVEWVQRSTGLIEKGEEDLHKSGDGWMPVAWLEYRGNIYRSTLSDMAQALALHTTITIKEVFGNGTVNLRSLTLIHKNDADNLNVISEVLNEWWNIGIKGEYADIVEVSYQDMAVWPPKEYWVGIGGFDDDGFVIDDITPGGWNPGGKPVPGKPGPPGPAPLGPPMPGPPGPPGPNGPPPPPFPGPEVFINSEDDGDGGKETPAQQKGREDSAKQSAQQEQARQQGLEQGSQRAEQGKQDAQDAAGQKPGEGSEGSGEGSGEGGEPSSGKSGGEPSGSGGEGGEPSSSGKGSGSGEGGEGDGDGDGTPSQDAGDDYEDAAKAAAEAVDGARQCCACADPESEEECQTAEQSKEDAKDALDAAKEAADKAAEAGDMTPEQAEAQKTKADALKDAVDSMKPGQDTSPTGMAAQEAEAHKEAAEEAAESYGGAGDEEEMELAVEEAMESKAAADKCNDKADMRNSQDQENVKKADEAAMDAIRAAEDAVDAVESDDGMDKDAADALREMLNEAFEEVEARQQERDKSQKLSEQAQRKAERSQELSNDGDNEMAKEQALDATEKCQDAAEAMNPYSDEDREALEDAIKETKNALNEVPPDEEVLKAMDELKALEDKMRKSQTMSETQWGIWGYGEGWLQAPNGGPKIFPTELEATDALRASGGRI